MLDSALAGASVDLQLLQAAWLVYVSSRQCFWSQSLLLCKTFTSSERRNSKLVLFPLAGRSIVSLVSFRVFGAIFFKLLTSLFKELLGRMDVT